MIDITKIERALRGSTYTYEANASSRTNFISMRDRRIEKARGHEGISFRFIITKNK